MADEERRDHSTPLEDLYAEYTVYNMHYEKIGKVDDFFVDENDNPEYVSVKMGFLDTRSTLIPVDIARVNDRRRLVESKANDSTTDRPGSGAIPGREEGTLYIGRPEALFGRGARTPTRGTTQAIRPGEG